jgi:MFS family permease
VLYGTEGLRLGPAIIGLGLTTQVIGRMFAGFFLGFGIEKLGARATLLGGLILCALAPGLAVLTPFLSRLISPGALLYLYSLVFLFLGVSLNAVTWAFTNYILDIAPPEDRSTYMGLTNTISGLLIVAPLLGGALLQLTSYTALFAVALAVYLAALMMALRLPLHHRDQAI